jgi:hypothetical protein
MSNSIEGKAVVIAGASGEPGEASARHLTNIQPAGNRR